MDDEQRKQQQAAINADPNSHMRPGGLFDPARKKASKILIVEDTADVEVAARDAKQTMRRQDALSNVIQEALVTRVADPGGPSVYRATFDEFVRMKDDPEFVTLAQYARNLVLYADGTPRPTPIRPLLENEMGMWRGKVVVVTNNPGDSHVGTFQQVKEQLVEPDPFPSEPTAVTKPDLKVLGDD